MRMSGESNRGASAVAYTLAAFAGTVPLSVGLHLRSEGPFGPTVALSTALIVLAGLIFTGLGLYSSVHDERNGFAIACMAVGAVVIGMGQMGILY